jgi:CDP-diacylglycerol--glycerol-3-phosphate 3-phosphatidyltransferase
VSKLPSAGPEGPEPRGGALARAAEAAREGVPDPAGVAPVPGAPILNIANGLTGLRLALVPVVLVLLFEAGGHQAGWRVAAWGGFAVAGVTDHIDGEVARRRHLVTSFGKLIDPIADKALIGGSLIGLSVLGDLPVWVTVVVLTREVGVTLLRFWVIRHGVIPASRGGKLKTLLQAVAIGLYLLPIGAGPLGTLRAVLMGIAVVVTVVTGLDYIARALRLRQTSDRAAMKRARRAQADSA